MRVKGWRVAGSASRLTRPRPAHQLGRARPGPRRPGNLSGFARHRHRHLQPLTAFRSTVRTAREKGGFRAGLRRRENPALSVGRKLLGSSTVGPHPAQRVPDVAPRDPPRQDDACRSAIGRPILSVSRLGTAERADLSAHESLASREMVAEVQLTGLSFRLGDGHPVTRPGSPAVGTFGHDNRPHRWAGRVWRPRPRAVARDAPAGRY